MMKSIEIHKDASGKTLEYELMDDVGEVLICGDGYETEDEIKEFWHKVYIVLKNAYRNGEFDKQLPRT